MLVLSIQLKATTLKDMVEKTDHLWAFIKIGCGMLNPVAWNSPNNSSATLESASAEGFRGSILFITLEAYSVVECNTQDCLNTQKVHAWSENLWHQLREFHKRYYVYTQKNKDMYLLGGTQARPGLLLLQKAQLRELELLKEKPWTGTWLKQH